VLIDLETNQWPNSSASRVRSPLAGSVVDTAYLEAGRRAATSALGEDDRNITTASLSEAADWIGTGSWIGPTRALNAEILVRKGMQPAISPAPATVDG